MVCERAQPYVVTERACHHGAESTTASLLFRMCSRAVNGNWLGVSWESVHARSSVPLGRKRTDYTTTAADQASSRSGGLHQRRLAVYAMQLEYPCNC